MNPLLSYLLRLEKVVSSLQDTICFIPCFWVVFSEERTMCFGRLQPVPNSTTGTRKWVFNQRIIKTGNLYRRLSLRKFDIHWHAEGQRKEKCSKVPQYTPNEKKDGPRQRFCIEIEKAYRNHSGIYMPLYVPYSWNMPCKFLQNVTFLSFLLPLSSLCSLSLSKHAHTNTHSKHNHTQNVYIMDSDCFNRKPRSLRQCTLLVLTASTCFLAKQGDVWHKPSSLLNNFLDISASWKAFCPHNWF